jgi:hypothetical protein
MATEQSYSHALDSTLAVRRRFIELTHEIPKGAPEDLYRKWNVADNALLDFIRSLEAARDG